MFRIVAIIIGYCLGLIQTAYFIGKISKKIDIRDHGSGNSGTTNAIRVMGWRYGIITFCFDILKAVIAIIIAIAIYNNLLAGFYAGLGVIIGHNWPLSLSFRGGKGIASTIGVMYTIDYRIGLIMTLILALVVYFTRYVSLGSIIIVSSIPILLLLFGYLGRPNGLEYIAIGVGLMIIAIYKHRGNIQRLCAGTENKLGHKKTAA